jgi:hypothetical protein
MIGLVTSTGLLNYQLTYFLDQNPANALAGMTYANYLLQNCSVVRITLDMTPSISNPYTGQVTTCFALV